MSSQVQPTNRPFIRDLHVRDAVRNAVRLVVSHAVLILLVLLSCLCLLSRRSAQTPTPPPSAGKDTPIGRTSRKHVSGGHSKITPRPTRLSLQHTLSPPYLS
jgi:hypothetical protein